MGNASLRRSCIFTQVEDLIAPEIQLKTEPRLKNDGDVVYTMHGLSVCKGVPLVLGSVRNTFRTAPAVYVTAKMHMTLCNS
jgi:hypothetical protein